MSLARVFLLAAVLATTGCTYQLDATFREDGSCSYSVNGTQAGGVKQQIEKANGLVLNGNLGGVFISCYGVTNHLSKVSVFVTVPKGADLTAGVYSVGSNGSSIGVIDENQTYGWQSALFGTYLSATEGSITIERVIEKNHDTAIVAHLTANMRRRSAE